jgi:thioredoxin reductase
MAVKRIIVIGGGLAGRTCIKALRDVDKDSSIVLVDKNAYSADRQRLITELDCSTGIELNQFAQESKVEFLQDSIERINPTRKRIFFKENQPREYDVLVLATGVASKKLEIKGDHREGFFYLSAMQPVILKDLLRISDEVLISISTNLGFKLLSSLKKLGKEARVIAGNWDWLGHDKESIVNVLKAQEVPCYFDAKIDEAIGEGVVKAVKIMPLKVLSSQLVFMDTGFTPNLSFFEQEITVREGLFTDFEDILVTGTASLSNLDDNPFFSWDNHDIELSAKQCAQFILTGVHSKQEISQTDESLKKSIIEDITNRLQTACVQNKQES